MVYIISNIAYDENNKLCVAPEDLLVFLNNATSLPYYKEHANKLVIRRSTITAFNTEIPADVELWYAYGSQGVKSIPQDFVKQLSKEYDLDFEGVSGQPKSPTTGYIAVKYFASKYGDNNITLVNFGYLPKKSTIRTGYHNWHFEAEELAKYKHIYTAPLHTIEEIEVVYIATPDNLETLSLSAKSVLKHNPKAHITVISSSPLELPEGFTNIIVDPSKYKFYSDQKPQKAQLLMMLPEVLQQKDKVLYLDTRVICTEPLYALWNTSVKAIAAAPLGDIGKVRAKKLSVKAYHSSKILLLNLQALRDISFTKIGLFAVNHLLFSKYVDNIVKKPSEAILNACFSDFIQTLQPQQGYLLMYKYNTYQTLYSIRDSAQLVYYPKTLEEKMIADARKEIGDA